MFASAMLPSPIPVSERKRLRESVDGKKAITCSSDSIGRVAKFCRIKDFEVDWFVYRESWNPDDCAVFQQSRRAASQNHSNGKSLILTCRHVSTIAEACYPATGNGLNFFDYYISPQAAKFMSIDPKGDVSSDDAVSNPAEETIALDMFLKLANVVQSGGQAKHLVQSGGVLVNGAVEVRRGRKLRPGDTVEVNGEQFVIESDGL